MNNFKGISLKQIFVSLTMAGTGLLSGCASPPSAIAVQDDIALLNYELLRQNIEDNVLTDKALLNQKARWAGKIVSVQNNDAFSKITISYYPSSTGGRPDTKQQSSGQFVAIVPGYVESRVFKKGRLVTVLGNNIEPLSYPSLFTDGLYMWKDISLVRSDPLNMLGIANDERGHLNNPRGLSPFAKDEIGIYDNFQTTYQITENNGDSQSIVVKKSLDLL
jgi:starvation-inducible outer membrane lipoprotein